MAVGLVGILVNLRPASGAHMNPAITLGAAIQGDVQWMEVPRNVLAQFLGAVGVGVPLMLALGPPLLARACPVCHRSGGSRGVRLSHGVRRDVRAG